MIGPSGERWAPVHAVIPHSGAVKLMTAIENLFVRNAVDITKHDIGIGYLLTTVGASAVVIEPVFFWPDELMEFHKRNIEKSHLRKINGFAQNLEARECVVNLRKQLKELCLAHSATHFQIGKTYLYHEGMEPDSLALVKAVKQHMDKDNKLNPGALGFS